MYLLQLRRKIKLDSTRQLLSSLFFLQEPVNQSTVQYGGFSVLYLSTYTSVASAIFLIPYLRAIPIKK